jgi:lipopolysaccharide export system permease protein
MLLSLLILSIILIFDIVEQIRVFANYSLPFYNILKLSLFRMFYLMQKIIAYAVLLAGITTYYDLTKNSELAVIKAAGISNFRIIIPTIFVATLFGFFMTMVINPLTARMVSEYEKMEVAYKKGLVSSLALSKTGLWIKDNQQGQYQGTIIHALRVSQTEQELYDVTFYILNESKAFLKRFDLDKVKLEGNTWVGKDAIEYDQSNNSVPVPNFILPTQISFNQIEESMLMPETISFWRLSNFIAIAEASGFSAIKHKIYFYKLLIQPFYFAAMVILGIAFSLKMPRSGKSIRFIGFGLCLGFAINFFEYFVLALGTAGKIPVIMSSASPTVLTLMLGIYLHLSQES